MILVVFLLVVGRALALDWWVPTDAAAAGVRGALAAVWPGADIEVRVGPWPGFGVGSDASSLWVVADGIDRDEAAPEDPVIRVVLVRAWLRVPPRPVIVERMPPAPAPAPGARDRWTSAAGLLAGPGLGVSAGAPPLSLAAVGGGSWRQLLVGGAVDAGIGGLVGATGNRHPLAHQRVGGVLLVGVRAPLWGGDLEVSAGAGVRVWTLADRLTAGETAWSPRFALAERLGWWRPIGGPWGFGIALRVDVDDPGHASDNLDMRTPDGSAGHVPTAYLAIEAGLRHRWTP